METQLERLNKRAEQTNKILARTGRRIRAQGLKKLNNRIKRTKREAFSLGTVLGGVFAGLAIERVLSKFVELSDTFTNYQNRLKIVTKDTEELNSVTAELFDIADRTRSAYGATAELFARVSLASKELGKSQRDLLQFTESLNKAVILSGASAQEARAGIIQLSQGLAAGALRGDELRSVLEQLPKVADVLAKSMGVTRGELRKLGEEGKLTGVKIVDAMLKAAKSIDEDFAKTVPTIGQALTQLESKLVELVGGFNEVTGASTGFAFTIQFLSNNLPTVVAVLGTIAFALGIMAAKALFATAAVGALVAAAPAIGAIAAIVGVATASFQLQKEIIDETTEAIKNQAQAATLSSFGQMGAQAQALAKELETVNRVFEEGGRTNEVAAKRAQQLALNIAILKDRMRGSAQSFKENTKEAQGLRKALAEVDKRSAKSIEVAKKFTRERKLHKDIEKELARVLKATGTEDTTGKIREQVEAQQLLIRTERERTKVLESIKGPQLELTRNTEILNGLLKEGAITGEEFKKALAGLKDLDLKLPELPEDLFTAGAASLVEALNRIKNASDKAGDSAAVMGEKQKEALLQGVDGADTLRQKVLRIEEAANRAGVSAQVMGAAVKEVLGKSIDQEFADSVDDLRFRLEQGLITQRMFNEEVRKLEPIGKKSATTLEQGITRALEKIRDEANDLAAVGEKLVNVFADRAVEAIQEFAETGKFSFKEFARSLLADIAKIIIRLLIVKALSTLVGGAAAPAADLATTAINSGNSTNQGKQDGGTVQPGRPVVVGENGPEVLVPGRTGTIIPNARDQQQLPPEVNIGITNVTDPNEVPAAMDAGDFDENIVNVIIRNRDAVRQGIQQ